MDKLQAMTVFVKIAQLGSLTSAADAMNKSLPAVVRTLAALEQELKVRLFNRTTRKIAITEEGRIYLQHCQKILADIQDAEQLLNNDQTQASGTITLTAPVRFGEMYVNPVISRFLKQHPQMHIKLLLMDRVVNMLDEGIDLAVRIAHIGDSSVIAKPLGEIRQVVCASPEVLKKYGTPKHPKALSKQPCIIFTGLQSGKQWKFQHKGKPLMVNVDGPFECNQVKSSVDSCINGHGFGLFLDYQVKPWIESGDLIVVLEEFAPLPTPVNIVFHHSKLMASRVRLFVDYLSQELNLD